MSWQYKKRVYDTFKKVKGGRFGYNLPALIPVYSEKGTVAGWLKPLIHGEVTRSNATRLARWRKENSFAFPTQFKVTVAGTMKWLQNQVLDNPERILFYVFSASNKRSPIGHMGLASFDFRKNICEIDNVVRGEKFGHKGLMGMALRSLINWSREYLRPCDIFLRVMSDNQHAIKFYAQLGFIEIGHIPVGKQKFLRMKYEK